MLINEQNTPETGPPAPASLRNRAFAYLLDKLFVLPFSLGLMYTVIYLKSLPVALLFIVGEALYKPMLEAFYGYTLGKKVMKLKVVSQKNYSPITLNQSLFRFTPWALAYYAAIFVMVRYFESPDLLSVTNPEEYLAFMSKHPLSNSFLIAILNSLWIFSVTWVFSDPLRRALHDRLGGTMVVEAEDGTDDN